MAALLAPGVAAGDPGTGLTVLSTAPGGGPADGISRDPAISQDKRTARIAAFDTTATNLGGAAGGGRNVYIVRRKTPYGPDGDPWLPTAPVLISTGLGGAPANGPSSMPALDGSSRDAPHCVAFVSAASNLVRGDTNGKPDAFVRDLNTGRTIRVSVDSRGRQSHGTVTEVSIDGRCTRVAFVSDAPDLALTRTANPSWKSAVTRAPARGRRQVYVRVIGGATGLDRALKGLTFLASAAGRSPGSGDSFDVKLANNARSLVFTSSAPNLVPRDGNGTYDVFQRTMTRAYGRAVRGHRPQYLQMANRLISQAADRSAGSGPSFQPATNADGTTIAYATTAANIVGASVGANSQIVRARLTGAGPPEARVVSDATGGGPGNGPSSAPVTNYGGSWVIYQTLATDIGVTPDSRRTDDDATSDVLLWVEIHNLHWLMSTDDAAGAATHPVMSPHGNYLLFEQGGGVVLDYLGPK